MCTALRSVLFMKTHPLLVFDTYRIDKNFFDIDKSLVFAKELYRMDRSLSLSQVMVWDDKDYPGVLGTFAPIWYKKKMYMLTAKHCVLKQNLSNLSYIVDLTKKESLVFDEINLPDDDSEMDDFALIPVKDNGVSLAERASWAFDLERDCLSYRENRIVDVAFRGAPSKINEVDYDEEKIKTRCFFTNGLDEIKEDQENHPGCFWLKMKKPLAEDFENDANGLSGSIVYGMDKNFKTGILGILIKYHMVTKQYLVLSVDSILSSLQKK